MRGKEGAGMTCQTAAWVEPGLLGIMGMKVVCVLRHMVVLKAKA